MVAQSHTFVRSGSIFSNPSKEMADTLVPYVINLCHRKDRLLLLDAEFSKLNLPYTRIDAIYNEEDGALGCLQSHISILEKAEDRPIWVCEDDCTFLVDKTTLRQTIDAFLQSDAEVLLLGFNDYNHVPYVEGFVRTFNSQTTSCYIVKPSIREKLCTLWKSVAECRKNQTKHPLEKEYKRLPIRKSDFYCADQSWKILQQDHVFVLPTVRHAKQRESYSDIEKMVTAYSV